MTRYVTAHELAGVPALQGRQPEERRALLRAAGQLYGYIRDHEWLKDDELRRYGEAQGIEPDAMNAALDVLEHMGRIATVNEAPGEAPPEAAPESVGPVLLDKPLENHTLEELQGIAGEVDLPKRSGMKKADLIDALHSHAE